MTTFPLPPMDRAPRDWPSLTLYAATVLLEAEGEPDEGKLAVAYVIRNRMDHERDSLEAVVLKPWQFSCWNADYAAGRRARLTGIDARIWERCWWAASVAYWRLLPDPAKGSRFYLNPEATRRGRRLGDLPDWYDPARVVARIGRHEFLDLTA